MQRVSEQLFYEMGKMIQPLANLKPGTKLEDVYWQFYSADGWLRYFLEDKVIPLRVCKIAGYALLTAMQEVTRQEDRTKQLEFDDIFPVSSAVRDFDTVFAAELQTLDTYFVSQAGIYSTPDLIERAENVFPASTRRLIPPHAAKDVREAGRCLAFDLPTAAAFHILRATEALIREYLTALIGSAPAMRSRNWGRYITVLRRHSADEKILSALEQIREMHRNPVMHPEDFLSPEEALMLFGISQGVIVSLATAIQEHNSKHPKAEATTQSATASAVGVAAASSANPG